MIQSVRKNTRVYLIRKLSDHSLAILLLPEYMVVMGNKAALAPPDEVP